MNQQGHIEGWARAYERPLLRRLDDVATRVQQRSSPELTDFLTPREQILAQSMGGYHQLAVTFWGGYEEAERKRALFAPDYWQPEQEDYRITVLEGQLTGAVVSHGDVMGSLLGTGLKRQKVGDIGVLDKQVLVAVDNDIVEYVRGHWNQAGRAVISLAIARQPAIWPKSEYTSVQGTVPSLRLDAVIAEFCQWSRSKAQSAVTKGQVSLNFTPTTRSDEVVEEGDVLSVRGFGRLHVQSLEGTSKRGKLRVQVGVLKS